MQLTVPTRLTLAALGSTIAVAALAGPVAAKEASGNVVISSTVPAPSTACSPVSSLRAQGDTSTGETGMASIDVDYSVKPCDSKQEVTVETNVAESFDPTAVVWNDPQAPLSGKFTVYGVKLRTTYKVKVTVRDAGTGVVLGSSSVSASATPKAGV